MPPKKVEAPAELPVLGRFSSHLKIGVVGMPNVGKSTLFNLLTKVGVPAENFPFCTIEPNTARVNVPDERYTWLNTFYKPKSEVPAFLEVMDIAGLVKGASAGEGLGNAFLSHIKQVDGIFHVMRAFDEVDVIHVEERVDPVGDIEIITNELRLKDLDQLEKHLDTFKKLRSGAIKKEQKEEIAALEKIIEWLKTGKDVRLNLDWTAVEIDVINAQQLLSAKPCVFLINLSEEDYKRKKNKWLGKIAAWVGEHGGEPIIPFSAAFEKKLVDMPADEAAVYQKDNEIATNLNKIVKTGFKAIQLQYFFTAGEDEVRCWTIRKGMKAPQAAGTIHTDFERGFICAEVMKFEDLQALGSVGDLKAAGKYRQEGKNYVMCDGDIVFFKFNVTAAAKK